MNDPSFHSDNTTTKAAYCSSVTTFSVQESLKFGCVIALLSLRKMFAANQKVTNKRPIYF